MFGKRPGTRREKRFAHQFLRQHFEGRGSDQLVTHVRTFPLRFRPDLQIALDQIFATQRRPTKTLGLHRKFDYQTLTFPDLWLEGQHEAVPVGPLQHVDVDIGEDRPVKCLRQALWLLDDQGQRYAVMYGEADRYGDVSGVRLAPRPHRPGDRIPPARRRGAPKAGGALWPGPGGLG